jgi:glutamate synthase domain-containing protein 2
MSYGFISQEAHENLAIAMNRIGGKSNSEKVEKIQNVSKKEVNGDSKIVLSNKLLLDVLVFLSTI